MSEQNIATKLAASPSAHASEVITTIVGQALRRAAVPTVPTPSALFVVTVRLVSQAKFTIVSVYSIQ